MPFDSLSGLIHQLNIHDDAIVMDSKIRDLADYFQNAFDDEQQLKTVFQHFNRLALDDGRFAMNLAVFFASRILDSVLRSGSQVRAEMLNVLQQNYMDADALKSANPVHFYNSITLLGEYYHRVRIAANPVQILGQSLLQLLAAHLRADVDRHLADASHRPDVRYAKLILRQITLNGQLARDHHRSECEELLFECRRCLVLVGTVCATTRALLLMTLDLYYSNFGSLGAAVEALYVTYLADGDDDDEASRPKARPAQPEAWSAQALGVRAHAVVDTVVSSINGLGSELNKQGSGYQRPAGIKTEFLNRPKRASDRLRFVRQQTTAELEQDCEAFREQQRSFEQTVQQHQQQQQQQQQQPQPLRHTVTATVPEPDEPRILQPLQPLLLSPSYINANTNHPLTTNHTPSPRSSKSCASPRRTRSSASNSNASSAQSSPAKTPQTGRRRPLVAPISPPQNSDWFAEVEAHFAQGVDQARQDVCSPEDNGRGHPRSTRSNGSPNEYSNSVSPPQHLSQNGRQQSYSHSHDGENYQQGNGDRQAFSSPAKQRGGDRRRNGGGGRKNHGPNGRRNNDDANDSRYASKTSLQSTVSSRLGGNNEQQQQQRSGSSNGGNSNQLKPANRNNPFDRRSTATSKHHQHCDRGETSNDRRYGNGNGNGHNRRNNRDDQYDHNDRNPHAAHIAKEFMQFLGD